MFTLIFPIFIIQVHWAKYNYSANDYETYEQVNSIEDVELYGNCSGYIHDGPLWVVILAIVTYYSKRFNHFGVSNPWFSPGSDLIAGYNELNKGVVRIINKWLLYSDEYIRE